MRKFVPLAALALPLAACATSPYGSGYGGYGYNPVAAVIGALGSSSYGSSYGYGGFSQAAASACANYAARYGSVRVTSVRPDDRDEMKVYGYVSRGYGSDNWDCTFRSDGRITDFDI